uniref:glucan endo-1,3-beta-D-glucosidase n=1 Tax=Globisporangium ultimum (strain ATCC 200006 / CBS 805.95 / DAOM BR144) TaxID=431595 RepID=K3W690_GLOUD
MNLNVITPGSTLLQNVARPALMWRHGYSDQATLAEFSIPGDGKAWYDISIISPGSGTCKSFDECRRLTGKTGFNVGLAIVPRTITSGYNCRALYCLADRCDGAYQYPTDDWKTHDCPDTTDFDVVFCPTGSATKALTITTTATATTASTTSTTTASTSTSANAGLSIKIPSVSSNAYVRAKYAYKGLQAGNVLGYYDMVTNLKTCGRQRVFLKNRIGPLSEEVSMVFRGPMEIYNIAVYMGSAANGGPWTRVSWYNRGGAASNLIFMNNLNIDYSGSGTRGPQGFASADGKSSVSSPQPFSGTLAEASNPSQVGGGPGITTGVEVNIMTGSPCSTKVYDCPGVHGNKWSYHGWGGGKKIFVTRVKMPWGKRPNQPAIWMLNAQVLWSGQYACNCRGMGAKGGCGELDIAEVIETNANRDKVSTHYYFYDGTVASAPKGDNYATRPVDLPTVYITVLDSSNSVIKILETSTFGFAADVLSNDQVLTWLNT